MQLKMKDQRPAKNRPNLSLALKISLVALFTLASGCSQDSDNLSEAESGSSKRSGNSVSTGDSVEHGGEDKAFKPLYSDFNSIPATAFLEHGEVYNPEAVIPPQCYTKTDGVNNPCYVCHQSYRHDKKRTNQMTDGQLQGNYEFSDVGLTNSWKNLFVDRTEMIKAISDDDINDWVNTDNYTPFIQQLTKNKHWKGELPQLNNLAYPHQAFAENGLALDGSGWVAFNYKPFPSTFWPTNGSTGDVMIRLPQAFRQLNGQYSEDVYFANLSLLELALKGMEQISIAGLNEKEIGEDLNGDGRLAESADQLIKRSHFVGDASDIPAEHMLYPQGTEFLHTVRYIALDENNQPFNAPRMKEVRYMKKAITTSRQSLSSAYYREAKEKAEEKLPVTLHIGDRGIDNSFGWIINGYIENRDGSLRQQHKQELAFCNGCHKTVGSTYDQTFSFARKLDGAAGWGYIDLTKQQDVPNLQAQHGEYLTYMQRVGGGDEFRQNTEMLEKWFVDGQPDVDKIREVTSLYQLIMPSAKRAQQLNKAYKTIVDQQSFIFGRDANITANINVLSDVDDSQAPLQPEHRFQWDMRLDWSQQENSAAFNRDVNVSQLP